MTYAEAMGAMALTKPDLRYGQSWSTSPIWCQSQFGVFANAVAGNLIQSQGYPSAGLRQAFR